MMIELLGGDLLELLLPLLLPALRVPHLGRIAVSVHTSGEVPVLAHHPYRVQLQDNSA